MSTTNRQEPTDNATAPPQKLSHLMETLIKGSRMDNQGKKITWVLIGITEGDESAEPTIYSTNDPDVVSVTLKVFQEHSMLIAVDPPVKKVSLQMITGGKKEEG